MDNDRRILELVKSNKEKKDRVIKVMDVVKQNSSIIDSLVERLTEEYSTELDAFIGKIRFLISDIKSGKVTSYSQLKLEMQVLELAALMYGANDGASLLGSQSDVAQTHKDEIFAQYYAKADGTIPDKKHEATEKALPEILAAKAFERSASILRSKVKMANRMLEALKKVLTSRIVQQEVWRKEAPIHDNIDYADEELTEADTLLDKEE